MPLTDKQDRFVSEYLVDLNATQAAKRAGYSARTAAAIGAENLGKPEIQAAIAEAQARTRARLEITREQIAAEYAKLGFSNMADYMRVGEDGDPVLNFADLTRDQAAALAEVTVEDFKDGRGEDARDVRRVRFKLSDKRASLDSLSRLLGFEKIRHEHTGKDDAPLRLNDSRAALALLTVIGTAMNGSANGKD
ncbi:hypothetical protein MBUL_04450 (plasmid) [Methylobacterium bullatum]|uniref:Terminase small subunit n=1 Tax=Methylobacterium bullatum TaxID=570505 RepID=A0A679JNN7_9HYPH|nr:hypothetical protein MBUL_04450 [Methylobacterium bullatum]